jgi:hypothetical protein
MDGRRKGGRKGRRKKIRIHMEEGARNQTFVFSPTRSLTSTAAENK